MRRIAQNTVKNDFVATGQSLALAAKGEADVALVEGLDLARQVYFEGRTGSPISIFF
jgi:hypothetical protein